MTTYLLYKNTVTLEAMRKTYQSQELNVIEEEPIKTDTELLDFDIKLENDPAFRKDFVSFHFFNITCNSTLMLTLIYIGWTGIRHIGRLLSGCCVQSYVQVSWRTLCRRLHIPWDKGEEGIQEDEDSEVHWM